MNALYQGSKYLITFQAYSSKDGDELTVRTNPISTDFTFTLTTKPTRYFCLVTVPSEHNVTPYTLKFTVGSKKNLGTIILEQIGLTKY